MLSHIVSICVLLGLISASHIIWKLIYCELCDLKIPWDEKISDILKRKCKKWVQNISSNKKVLPRAKLLKLESVTPIDLHVFGDASILANCAAVYALVYQPSITNKGLLVISKKDVTIPRLELVSAHMGSNLVSNVLSALKTENIRSVVGWTDSTVVSCWLNQSESHKSFVANRVNKIKQNDYIRWQYVPTKQNPSDIGSRDALKSNLPNMWLEGPSWLTNSSEWPN